MDQFIFDKTNGLWYELHSDYYPPCVTVPERKSAGILGKRYRKHLKQHKNPVYTAMLLAGTLEDHVAEIDRQAEETLDRLIKQMAQQEGVTEQLKARDPIEWTRQMNSIHSRATEIVNSDLIYAGANAGHSIKEWPVVIAPCFRQTRYFAVPLQTEGSN